jgi:2-haloacid dehalogenase
MKRVMDGSLPWMRVDALHRLKLDELLERIGADGVPEAAKDCLNRVWHRLRPWPDTPRGLDRLRTKFIVASLSNGNVSLLTNMAKNGGFHWDCVLSAELASAYKPDPRAYQTAAELLGLATSEVMMVAAHKHDLEAARETGMASAFVRRPDEYGPDRKPDLTPDSPSGRPYDIVADDFLHLADQLGCD